MADDHAPAKPQFRFKPEYIKLARAEAGARGVIYLLNSFKLQPDEKGVALAQAVGIAIADQVASYAEFQEALTKWTDLLRKYAEANKEAVDTAIQLNQKQKEGK